MKKPFAVIFLPAVFYLVPGVVFALPNPCFSTLSDALDLDVPAMSFEGSLYAFRLEFSASAPAGCPDCWFRLVPGSFGPSALTNCSYPAFLQIESGRIILRLPMVLYAGAPLWAELEVKSIADQIWLKVLIAGFMPNQVFVTSVKGNGDLGSWPDAGGRSGLEAGDAICQARAAAGGIHGTFKAWLSDSTSDAVGRLTGNGPWVRLDGVKVADSKADLTDGVLFAPINLTETLHYVGQFSAWTGTASDGNKTVYTCSDWTSSSSADSGERGIASDAAGSWTSNSAGCDRDLEIGLYCFED